VPGGLVSSSGESRDYSIAMSFREPARDEQLFPAGMRETLRHNWTGEAPNTNLAQALISDYPMREAKLLILDDDLKLRTLLLRYLEQQGFDALALPDATQLDRLLGREPFDMLILDIMLPGEDGLSICRRLRGSGNTIPIIMLTARGDDVDRIVGLEIGADDYLSKPYNPRELVARVRAVLRRRQPVVPGAPTREPCRIVFGPNQLDLATRELIHAGQPRAMTSGELAVLKALVSQPRIPQSRDKLVAAARGPEHEAGARSIDVQISRIRRLVEPDPASPRYIQTIWGVGYVFVPDNATLSEES